MLLSYGADAKKTHPEGGLWCKDTNRQMETVGKDNEGYQHLCEFITKSREVELLRRLHPDVFMQDWYLLNGFDVKFRLVRSTDAFALIASGADPGFIILLTETFLLARKAKVKPALQVGHIRALTKGTATY